MMRVVIRNILSSLWLFAAVLLPSGVAADEIPEAARVFADSQLVEWKARVLRSPEFFRVDTLDVDIRAAVFGRPFSTYTLREDALVEWNRSAAPDARPFANIRAIEFPVMVDSVFCGSLVITPNRRDDGLLDERRGDYTFSHMTPPPRNHVIQGVESLLLRFPGHEVAHIRVLGAESFYLLTDSAGVLYRTSDPDDGLPLYKLPD